MLEEERRNNFALRLAIDNIQSLLSSLEQGKLPDSAKVADYKKDFSLIVDSITNYHARFKEVLETINHIKELHLPTSLDESN